MAGKITFEELLIQMMPFSDELIKWCKKYPDFLAALKVIYSDRFIALGAIVTSYSLNFPEDEVIGIYAYDYKRKNPLFKQDFIVNKGKRNEEFILYTRNSNRGSSKFVKDINDFFKLYGRGGFYTNSHHLSLEQLPEELKERGQRAINLANKLKGGIFVKPPQELIDKTYNELLAVKRGEWYVKKKLDDY